MAADQFLNSAPGRLIHQRLVFSGIPVAVVDQFPNIGAIVEHRMQRTAGKLRGVRAIRDAFAFEPFDQRIKRQVLVGEQMEHPPDLRTGFRANLDNAAAVLAHVDIAVRCPADKPALLNASSQALANID